MNIKEGLGETLKDGELKENNISFHTKDGNSVLILSGDGDIYVKGKLVENDKEVVEAMREFLRSTGHLKN